jgi:hypothetical protein
MMEWTGRVWSSNGRNEKCIQKFGQKNFMKRDHLTDLGGGEMIILKRVSKT